MKSLTLTCFLVFVALGHSLAAELEMDYFWQLKAPDGWKVKVVRSGQSNTYLCSPDLQDGALKWNHFYVSDVIRSPQEEPLYCRGFAITFGTAGGNSWVIPPSTRREKIKFFDKEVFVHIYESTAPGRKFAKYLILTDTTVYGYESHQGPESLAIDIFCYTPEEFAGYMKLVESIYRRK